ncbi:ead/Ea22-like family protein [Enterobacter cloacae complex sp. CDL006]|uniref:ead/Ea22-like family protein n=1 Tax=Enterobacter TaxID=547 RepID=UPI0005383924|nr:MULTISPECIES: ead/Ea22-like family protein [Enterobacter]EHE7804044.1 ead/Ea22-like family protein [Enterobacter hormaechei]EIY1158234.1 ead/Ea22-like family protein [Enterobacter hormaechei]EKL0728600.1 ead/Ea22-like family protein [Enterobacter hormaechei]EKS6630906.1 ead/Ea22-like family protein [Enterobacter hormaechei]EKW1226021.1 ead/Ea22-like family protein [Enterobacter hormaechei]
MSNIDKQSLRQTAEKAQEHGVFNMDIHSQTVLALLDELEAKDQRIAELEASHGNLREAMAGIHNTITGGGAHTPLAAVLNASKRAYEESAAAAGKGGAS